MHIYPKIEPIEPPIISRGKNIPPGAPEPKLIIENNNLPIKTKNNIILTTKKNATFHGLGLKSIKLAIKKYNGHLSISYKNGITTLIILMDNPQKQIGELDSYLSLDINEKELQKVYKKIKKAEEKLIKDQVKMSALEQKRTAANSKVMTTTSEFNKYVEAYLATAESRDSSERTIKYSNIALSILDKYQVELQKRKTDILAETITSCYKKLANKKNLINKIVMESDSLAIKYLSEEGKEVTQDSLSAGEQQLMVISILWALAICSKKKLPVIIDTPLSRLDSLHRIALINTYFPNAGEQTIILSTDSEIDSTYYDLMKDNVGDEFTLKYDEKTKSTSIERGYLIGA